MKKIYSRSTLPLIQEEQLSVSSCLLAAKECVLNTGKTLDRETCPGIVVRLNHRNRLRCVEGS